MNWLRGWLNRRRGLVCVGCGKPDCPRGPYRTAPEGWLR